MYTTDEHNYSFEAIYIVFVNRRFTSNMYSNTNKHIYLYIKPSVSYYSSAGKPVSSKFPSKAGVLNKVGMKPQSQSKFPFQSRLLSRREETSQYSVSTRRVVVKEINREKRDKSANKMNGRNVGEGIDPPHANGTAGERKRLKEEEDEEHRGPVAFRSFL